MQKIEILIIDPQNDFCDRNGSLFVAGADQDSERLAAMLQKLSTKIYDIHVTLDTHHWYDIAHPGYWRNSQGETPEPFTLISVEDVAQGVWVPADPRKEAREYALNYVRELRDNNRYQLCIWPPHCLIGTPGHNVVSVVGKALAEWEKQNTAMVDYVTKGSNYMTEHYSAVQADVPDGTDPTTLLNTRLIKTLEQADIIALSGQALSHCVANTVRDIADNFGEENIKKLVLIEDTTSPVPGFENLAEEFLLEMKGRGMQVAQSTDFLM